MRTLNLFLCLASGVLLAAPDSGDYRISGPYSHDNLSIFLIHGMSSGNNYLTLKEGLEQKKVVVYETQTVNQLAIENLSDKDVFVQGGDIVKGGQQDRVLENDFVLPAKSGRLPISAFCVEPGRWTRRGTESVRMFSSSTETVGNADMAKAVKVNKNQAEVWKEVAKTQDALAVSARRSDARSSTGAGVMASTSSLQLTLESKAVTDAVEGYLKALVGVVQDKPDVVGFAFAVNGKISSADVYASAPLFGAMWPKLLKASAVEALRLRQDQAAGAPPVSAAEALLHEAEKAKMSSVKVGRVTLLSGEAGKQLMFESRDGDALIHRSYIPK